MWEHNTCTFKIEITGTRFAVQEKNVALVSVTVDGYVCIGSGTQMSQTQQTQLGFLDQGLICLSERQKQNMCFGRPKTLLLSCKLTLHLQI